MEYPYLRGYGRLVPCEGGRMFVKPIRFWGTFQNSRESNVNNVRSDLIELRNCRAWIRVTDPSGDAKTVNVSMGILLAAAYLA